METIWKIERKEIPYDYSIPEKFEKIFFTQKK